jgi:hypothetical protein
MSRKSDLAIAHEICERKYDAVSLDAAIRVALEAAYDLGRVAQAEKTAKYLDTHECWVAGNFTKRLRAKVRRMAGETK